MKEPGQVQNTLDRFAVAFWKDEIILENKFYPTGLIACEMLNIEEKVYMDLFGFSIVLQELSDPIIHGTTMGIKQKIDDIHKIICKMNAIIFELPLYSKLGLNREEHDNLLTYLDDNDISSLSNHVSEAYINVKAYIDGYIVIPHHIVNFGLMIKNLEHNVLQKLDSRDVESYAAGCTRFFTNLEFVDKLIKMSPIPGLGEFDPISSGEISVVVARHPENKERLIFIDRLYFNNMMSFLVVDLLKGFQNGHAPKKCKNCGRYFLNEFGYDTKYCDRVSPQRQDRTCRQIGFKEIEKEKLADDPVWNHYEKARKRITADISRKNITEQQGVTAKNEIRRLRDECVKGKLTYKELEEALTSKVLYEKLKISTHNG